MAKSLSPRLLDVLRLAAEGLTDKQIAKQLGVTPGTVATHWKRLRVHFNSSSRTEVVARVIAGASEARQAEDRSDRELLLFEIAQRERAEEELRRANEKLANLVQERADLLASVMAKYERKQTEIQNRLEDLEQLNMIMRRFGILASRGTYGASWRKTWCSEVIQNFGYTPGEVVNGDVTIFNTIVPTDLAHSLAEVEALEPGTPRLLCTHRIHTKDGRQRHLLDMLAFDPVDETGTGNCEMVAVDVTDWVDQIAEKISDGWPVLPLKPASDSPI